MWVCHATQMIPYRRNLCEFHNYICQSLIDRRSPCLLSIYKKYVSILLNNDKPWRNTQKHVKFGAIKELLELAGLKNYKQVFGKYNGAKKVLLLM